MRLDLSSAKSQVSGRCSSIAAFRVLNTHTSSTKKQIDGQLRRKHVHTDMYNIMPLLAGKCCKSGMPVIHATSNSSILKAHDSYFIACTTSPTGGQEHQIQGAVRLSHRGAALLPYDQHPALLAENLTADTRPCKMSGIYAPHKGRISRTTLMTARRLQRNVLEVT